MNPAKNPQRLFEQTKMMAVSSKEIVHTTAGYLPSFLRAGDVLAVNTSGTLPSSFWGRIARTGAAVEIRLAAFRGENARKLERWAAISFGSGDWRLATEERGPAPQLKDGDRINFAGGLSARVLHAAADTPRLLLIEFDGTLEQIYRAGRPIQYSYLTEEIQLWDQQTLFTGAPLSVEAPSAAFPLNWDLILRLKQAGIRTVPLLHGAGISSSGEADLDRKLPLEEYFEIPEDTWRAIENAKRVVAVGTSAVRALESAARLGTLRGYTDFKLSESSRLMVAGGIITGMHEEGTSHAELMKAFCGGNQLAAANKQAAGLGYRSHEFGDWTLLAC